MKLSYRGWWLLGLTSFVLVVVLVVTRPATSNSANEVQLGLASYYGPGFQGERTANGEIFDQRKMVAAHRTLPLGSVVRVTNLDNGRQVELRVIDRGPYGKNRRKGTIIDVSKGAARRLDFLDEGVVRVRVEVLERPAANEKGTSTARR